MDHTGPRAMSRAPRSRRAQGADAEILARRYLEQRGLICRAQNVHGRGGELDLVMEDHGTLVFVEVRQRSRTDYGSAAASITATKRRRIIRCARQYLHRHRAHEQSCRFDVVTVDGDGHADWLQAAFTADD